MENMQIYVNIRNIKFKDLNQVDVERSSVYTSSKRSLRNPPELLVQLYVIKLNVEFKRLTITYQWHIWFAFNRTKRH